MKSPYTKTAEEIESEALQLSNELKKIVSEIERIWNSKIDSTPTEDISFVGCRFK
jgi:hypothetical protein